MAYREAPPISTLREELRRRTKQGEARAEEARRLEKQRLVQEALDACTMAADYGLSSTSVWYAPGQGYDASLAAHVASALRASGLDSEVCAVPEGVQSSHYGFYVEVSW